MSSSTLTPHLPSPNSLAGWVIKFFAANPEETLSAEDIEIKFGDAAGTVKNKLANAVSTGWLEIAPRSKSLFRAGPTLHAHGNPYGTSIPQTPAAAPASTPTPKPAPQPASEPVAQPAAEAPQKPAAMAAAYPAPVRSKPARPVPPPATRRPVLPAIDISQVETYVGGSFDRPPHRTKGQTKYHELLDTKLPTVDSWFLLPRTYEGALAKAAKIFGQATGRTVRVQRHDADHCRVHRTA